MDTIADINASKIRNARIRHKKRVAKQLTKKKKSGK
jgi:hypothetical protein